MKTISKINNYSYYDQDQKMDLVKIGRVIQAPDPIGWVSKQLIGFEIKDIWYKVCLLYTSPSPRDRQKSRMPSSA